MDDIVIGSMLWSLFTLPLTAILLVIVFAVLAADVPANRRPSRGRRLLIAAGLVLLAWSIPGIALLVGSAFL